MKNSELLLPDTHEFYERMPNLLHDLVCEVRDLKEEVKELRKELAKG